MLTSPENRLRWLATLLQSIPDPVWVKDPSGVFLACNASFCRYFDADEADIVGKTDYDFVEPELAAFFQENDRRCMASGQSHTNEEWVTYAGGRRALWETAKTPLYDSEGRVIGVLGVARDITEHKRLETLLRAKEEYLRALIDNFPFPVWLKDTESRFLAINQPYADAIDGTPADSFPGKDDFDLWPREQAERNRADDREVLDSRQQKIVEEQLEWHGERRWFETYKAPVEVDGKLLGTVGFARDITERRQMVEQLRASERQFRILAENSPNAIIRYDRDCRRIYVNPAYAKITEIPLEFVLNHTIDHSLWRASPSAEEYQAVLRQVMESGVETEILLRWPRLDSGRIVSHLIQLIPEFDHAGQVVGALGIGLNITAFKETEQSLQASRDMLRELAAHREEAREEERKHIAREVHDELGQYLTALRMGLSALRFQFGQSLPALEKRSRELEAMADQTIQVVRDVSYALRPPVLDMGLPSALGWLAGEFSRTAGIHCDLRVPDGRVVLEDVRATAVFRIVQESLTNVARHSGASRVDIALTVEEGECRVRVRDNGKGFDLQAPRNNALGLMGMQERGRMLGGLVSIDSAPGRGTIVQVRIPLTSTPER
jgi:PAS domain S-box-containing protein